MSGDDVSISTDGRPDWTTAYFILDFGLALIGIILPFLVPGVGQFYTTVNETFSSIVPWKVPLPTDAAAAALLVLAGLFARNDRRGSTRGGDKGLMLKAGLAIFGSIFFALGPRLAQMSQEPLAIMTWIVIVMLLCLPVLFLTNRR